MHHIEQNGTTISLIRLGRLILSFVLTSVLLVGASVISNFSFAHFRSQCAEPTVRANTYHRTVRVSVLIGGALALGSDHSTTAALLASACCPFAVRGIITTASLPPSHHIAAHVVAHSTER